MLLLTLVLALPVVQTSLAQYATNTINERFGTTIKIEKLRVSLISLDASLKGVYVEDYKKDTLFYISALKTSILSVSKAVDGDLTFGHVDISSLDFKMRTYIGERNSNLEVFVDKLDDGSPRVPGTPPFFLSASSVSIAESRFRFIDENLEKPKVLDFKKLTISADDFQILGPEVTTDITNLSFDTPRGLSVTKLATGFTYTKQQMRFDDLILDTPESAISGDLVFNYNREDFSDFLNKVNLSATFSESKLSLNEINLLFPYFGKDKLVQFSAGVTGTLNNLKAKRLFLVSDDTGIRGDFVFNDLFTKSKAFQITADLRSVTTNYYQLRGLMPNLLNANTFKVLERFGTFTVRGDAEITPNYVNAKVNLGTDLGDSYVDLKLTGVDDIDNASYKGFVSLIDFDLGKFTKNKQFGKTTLDANVEGNGFIQESLNTEVIGEVYALDFNDYNYTNINVSGILKEQLFDGSLLVNDPNFKLIFKGLADFSSEENAFNFKASVDYADLKKLNFINDSLSVFKGNITTDISGNTLDNIVGSLSFTETTYQNKNDVYVFDDFEVVATTAPEGLRNFTINSPDIITGFVNGNFKVAELGKLAQNAVGSIYTNYTPFEIKKSQSIAFNFKIYNKIIDVFFPEIKLAPNTSIRGEINTDKDDFKLNFKSPGVYAYGNTLDSIELKIDTRNPIFNTYVSVSDVKTPYYDVKDFNLINATIKDTLFFRTEFKGGESYNDRFNLNFYHTFNSDKKSVLGLKKSDISFKGNQWFLNEEGNAKNKVIVNKTLDTIVIEEVVMNHKSTEQIRLQGKLSDSTFKDVKLQFKNVALSKIAPTIDSLGLEGNVNGTLSVYQKGKVFLPSTKLDITDFTVNDFLLGVLNIGIVGNNDLTEFVVNADIGSKQDNTLSVYGKIHNQESMPEAELVATLDKFKLAPFSPLGEGVIDDIRGLVTGTAKITGPLNNTSIDGQLNLQEAGLSVPYLNVNYGFANNSKVNLYGQTFDFSAVKLTDVAKSTTATLDGEISHQQFGSWNLDLAIDTKDDRLLILNTPYEEDVLYYGDGYLKGSGRIFGPTRALTITVEGETARGTSLKIPLSDVVSLGDYSFINFKEKSDSAQFSVVKETETYEGLELAFDLAITPEAEVEIVIDTKTGSALRGTGEGLILMEINTNDKFIMNGEFAVVTGEYRFKKGVIDKTFKVNPGGTIVWEGEPLKARINMEASYLLNANPAPLLDGQGYSKRIPTEVLVQLTGALESPEVAFNINFPGTNSIVKSELEYSLQDPTIEEKNAFFLLAQGTFANEQASINQQALTGNLIQTASGLFNQMFGGDANKLGFGVSYEQGYLDATSDIQTENRIGVTVSTQINDNIFVNGRVGVPVGGVSETVVAGDVEVQIILNEEGTLSAKIFNRENEIQQFIAERQGYTQGVGLSYEVDFNSFKELIQKIFKPKSAVNFMQPPPVSTLGKQQKR